MTRTRRVLFAMALAGLWALLGSCADCFFIMRGHLVECGTTTPIPAASVSVHIDSGLHGNYEYATTFMSDDMGVFKVSTDGTEMCSATATLSIRKDGFIELDQTFKGAPKLRVELCMTRMAPAQ